MRVLARDFLFPKKSKVAIEAFVTKAMLLKKSEVRIINVVMQSPYISCMHPEQLSVVCDHPLVARVIRFYECTY